ncbi:MAG: hypothetical protein AB1714_03635 [Acidobacteriota bacterium]
MLETLGLDQKLSKEEYASRMERLNPRLNLLQRQTTDAKMPVVLVFEGWEASGKGTCINQLVEWLDPRRFRVYPIFAPTPDEQHYPWMSRFWQKIPSSREWAIFDRSWYRRVLVERVDRLVHEAVWQAAFNEINAFERQLCDGGYVVMKFWLHITKKEQLKRFEKLEEDEYSRWAVTDEDRRENSEYAQYVAAIEDMLVKTSTYHAPWTIVEAMNRRFRQAKVSQTIVETLEWKLRERSPDVYAAYVETTKLIDEAAEKKA